MQKTVLSDVSITGVGLHSGRDIDLCIKPAPINAGITFIRTDITDKNNEIPALWNNVTDTQLCTVIANDAGANVGTIEHLMSALRGLGVDNAIIELNGAEVPIMDGSAMPFINAIDAVGIETQSAPHKVIKILKEVSVMHDGKRVTLKPANGYIFGGEIEFDHPKIGNQKFETQLVNGNFRHDIAEARTFGFLHEVEWMRSQGLAQGGSLDNAIVLDKDAGSIMNPDGLRFDNEFIRHKLLDAIGDLYLAGMPILGAYDGVKAGHAINNEILHALFADEDAYEIVSFGAPANAQAQQADALYA
ncbi:MAG: UDP-3-O-acyl-N-acetylglucosamine deacetylase [Alphaproteobacteria bacterium]|nr:UDP-3-O-acyl-N-acetylglucosamine deacetylase [Alphaproteobacteria bacterium]